MLGAGPQAPGDTQSHGPSAEVTTPDLPGFAARPDLGPRVPTGNVGSRLLQLLSLGFGTESGPRPRAPSSPQTKCRSAGLLRAHAGRLPPSASGCAARPRPAVRFPRRPAHARRRLHGQAGLYDARARAPPPPAAPAGPSGGADGRRRRAPVLLGPAERAPPPAPAAAGPPPPLLRGRPGTAASAPAREEAGGEVREGRDSTYWAAGLSTFCLWEFRSSHLSAPLFLCGEPSARPNPAVLGVFIGSGLDKGAGGPRVVHSGGPVQSGFSWGTTWEVVTRGWGQAQGFRFPRDPGLGGRAMQACRV